MTILNDEQIRKIVVDYENGTGMHIVEEDISDVFLQDLKVVADAAYRETLKMVGEQLTGMFYNPKDYDWHKIELYAEILKKGEMPEELFEALNQLEEA